MPYTKTFLGIICLFLLCAFQPTPKHPTQSQTLVLSSEAEKQTQTQTQSSPIILILDGSGSMWGKIKDQTKIEIAREVVSKLLDDMDPKRPIGLVAYGHRQKGDCEDIEYLHESATDNRASIKTSLKAINPVGKTPLADAALLVIDQLKTSGERATIILVSDGAESCGGDLCAVVKAAKEAGLDFVLHIVGFDIGESDKAALECAARAGEGLYLDASDSEELGAALEQASELTVEETEATLGVRVMKDGKLHDAMIKVYPAGEEEEDIASLRSYYSENSNPAMFHIPTGTYDIKVKPLATDIKPTWRKGIVVPKDEIPIVEVDFAPGTLSMLATNNGELWDCTLSVVPSGVENARAVSGGRTYTSPSSNPKVEIMDPGVYDIIIKAIKIKGEGWETRLENIEVKPGETTEVHHEFKSGLASISATHNGDFWDCTVKIKKDGKTVSGGRTYTAGPKEYILTPGTYEVIMQPLKLEAKSKTFSLTINAGETTEKKITF